jgi:hypothetical protein
VERGLETDRPRLASLDVLRGLTIVGMIVVNSASYLHYVSGYAQFASLEHAAWRGFTIADSVFPAFVFMTGVSIPLALAGRVATGLDGPILRRLLVRAGRLFLLGLILSNLYWMATPESVLFRPMGVLQRLALCFPGRRRSLQGAGTARPPDPGRGDPGALLASDLAAVPGRRDRPAQTRRQLRRLVRSLGAGRPYLCAGPAGL